MIQGLVNSGAIPVVERLLQFTSQRHKVLTSSIAHLSTPLYRPADLDPAQFQASLREAIDERRGSNRAIDAPLRMRDSRQVRYTEGGIEVKPGFADDNILFHDRNNRDLERTMQSLAENTLAHNAGIEMLKSEFDILRLAIRERL
jgi:flagellar basal-body rod protein FlgB